jgi:hypothetical protein
MTMIRISRDQYADVIVVAFQEVMGKATDAGGFGGLYACPGMVRTLV